MSRTDQIYNRVRDALLNCDQFQKDETLRALFVDQRVYPWRNSLSNASSPQERAQGLIDCLHDQYRHDTKENGLVLFLQVLSEHHDPATAIHHRLVGLAGELTAINISPQAAGQVVAKPQMDLKAMRQQLIEMDDTELDFFCEVHFPDLAQTKFSDNMAKDRKILLLIKHCRRDNYQVLQSALSDHV